MKNKVTRSLSVFYKNSGTEVQRAVSSIQVVDFYNDNEQNALILFGNENGNAVLSNYFFEGNYFSNSVEISSEPINSSCRVGESVFIFM